MTFKQLQDAVLLDRFGETKRADAKRWINYRYGRLWSTEDWAFKRAIADVAVSNAASSVSIGNFQRIYGLWDASISPLFPKMESFRPEDFYGESTLSAGTPYGFTIIGNTIYFDRPASGAKTYKAVGELKFTELVNDGDIPLIPSEFHQTIVSGAQAQGLREENDPTWNALEADFQAGVTDMKAGYLTQVRTYGDAYPDWP